MIPETEDLKANPRGGQGIQRSNQYSRPMRYGVLACLVLVGLVGSWGSRQSDADENNEGSETDHVHLTVEVFSAGSLPAPPLWARYQGDVVPRRQSVLAFRRSGRVTKVSVDTGDAVTAGRVLAKIETADVDASERLAKANVDAAQAAYDEAIAGPRYQTIRAAEARVQQLRSQLRSAETRLKRQETLMRRGAGSSQEAEDAGFRVTELIAALDEADFGLRELQEGTRDEKIRSAAADLERTRAQLDQVGVDRADSQIVAPYDGMILRRDLDEGTIVASGQQVFTMMESPPLEARFGVPADVARDWHIGQRTHVTTESMFNTPFDIDKIQESAVVVRMDPALDLSTRTRGIEVRLDPSLGAVAGQTATLWINRNRSVPTVTDGDRRNDAFWIPTTALVRGTRGLWSVYIVAPEQPTKDDAARATTKDFTGKVERWNAWVVKTVGSWTQIRLTSIGNNASKAGHWIVASGTTRIGPGVFVKAEIHDPLEYGSSEESENSASLALDETVAR
ncbi:MAG: HlyD family efflux transporter periplasmic adaptor subunit [Planctomycetota bacterium]